jgi:hypothetical protein
VTSPVIQVRVPEDTVARIDQARGDDTRSAWLQRLIDRELNGQQPAPALTSGSWSSFPVAVTGCRSTGAQ